MCAALGAAAAPSLARPLPDPVPPARERLTVLAPHDACFRALPGDYADPLPGHFPMPHVDPARRLVLHSGPGPRPRPRPCLGTVVPLGGSAD